MSEIHKILIANRGEIACRVIRTCRDMGIATVAVFSDADADAPHVALADEAVRIGPAPAADSYLRIDAVIAAAVTTGAGAVHPGYGFLAENAAFARACADARLVFIGPSADAIATLGSKRASKRLVAAAGVPVIPGSGADGGDAQDTASLSHAARDIGFPVLIKASAGGGGKGMRIVREPDTLEAAIDAARRESEGAFGDGTLLIEKYIERPRHVEIQILGDTHGQLVHLFERECSIQRRHQKIIEEAPSPALDDALRARMGEAAVTVGRAVGYHNAGTVEFILAPDGAFYFLEVNTRLQVEHPVTECVTGLDLVREQIRIARGEPLGYAQADIALSGAAIECRLYAEDPDQGFLPMSGRVLDWHVPREVLAMRGLRVDAGIASGLAVSIHYDPLLAKIIAHAPTRAEAIAVLAYALARLSVQGIATNRSYLLRILRHHEFLAGALDTHFLDRHAADLAAVPTSAKVREAACIAATLWAHEERRAARVVLPSLEPGYRNNRAADERVSYRLGPEASDGGEASVVDVAYRNLGGGRFAFRVGASAERSASGASGASGERVATVASGERVASGASDSGESERPEQIVKLVHRDGPTLYFEDGAGVRRAFRIIVEPADARLPAPRYHVHGAGVSLSLAEQPRFPEPGGSEAAGGCVAPMPGRVIAVRVSAGQTVAAGDPLVILEAMKMEHTVCADAGGVVATVAVVEGDQVDTEQLLAVIEPR